MATLAQYITTEATDLALGIVQRSTAIMAGGRKGTSSRAGIHDSIRVPAPERIDVTLKLDLVLETPCKVELMVTPRSYHERGQVVVEVVVRGKYNLEYMKQAVGLVKA